MDTTVTTMSFAEIVKRNLVKQQQQQLKQQQQQQQQQELLSQTSDLSSSTSDSTCKSEPFPALPAPLTPLHLDTAEQQPDSAIDVQAVTATVSPPDTNHKSSYVDVLNGVRQQKPRDQSEPYVNGQLSEATSECYTESYTENDEVYAPTEEYAGDEPASTYNYANELYTSSAYPSYEYYDSGAANAVQYVPYYSPEAQYYQPIVNTRNGPLMVNSLMYPYYGANGEVYMASAMNGGVAPVSRSHSSADSGLSYGTSHTSSNGYMTGQSSVDGWLVKSYCFPSTHIGLLIGTKGRTIKALQNRFGCEIWLDEDCKNHDICVLHIHGYLQDIEQAAHGIRRQLKDCDLTPLMSVPALNVLLPETTPLDLPLGVNVQGYVAHVDSANTLFMQLPSHPSFPRVSGLEQRLTNYYSGHNAPFIDLQLTPLLIGSVVATQSEDRWIRAKVISEIDSEGFVSLRSLDHGYSFMAPATMLKPLTSNFCHIPLQSIECRIANCAFYSGDELMNDAAQFVYTQIVKRWVKIKAVAKDLLSGVPMIEVFYESPDDPPPKKLRNLSKELIGKGYAQWTDTGDQTSDLITCPCPAPTVRRASMMEDTNGRARNHVRASVSSDTTTSNGLDKTQAESSVVNGVNETAAEATAEPTVEPQVNGTTATDDH